MANMCINFVTFQGNETQLKKVDQLIDSLILREQETKHGQLPEGIEGTTYFFSIYKNSLGAFTMETKWAPPIKELIQIADLYDLDFECSCDEMGSLIYGTTFYTNKQQIDFYLENDDFDSYDYDEDKDIYTFEGNVYESDTFILEEILERRIAKHQQSRE